MTLAAVHAARFNPTANAVRDGDLALRVAALPHSVAAVRATVSKYAARHTKAAVDDVALAVSEALNNAVIHAYVGRKPGTVHVVAFRTTGNSLVVSVSDNGRGMRPRPDSPGAGLGLTIMAATADALRIEQPRSGGTRVSMRFDAEAPSHGWRPAR
jgi:serine/threonine-protein kinase RsbW